MAEATLVLKGRSELAVRMALIAYQDELGKIKKKEEAAGVDATNTDELMAETKDILQQLGWKPKEKGGAEVVRQDGPTLFDKPEGDDEKDSGDLLDGPPANPPGPKVFEVQCPSLSCREKFQARGTTATCPKCAEVYEILADEDGEIVRLIRKKKPKGGK
jgi:hypothetical protein